MKWHSVTSRSRSRYLVVAGALAAVTVASACGTNSNQGTTSRTDHTSASTHAGTSEAVAAARANVAKYSAKVTDYPAIQQVQGGISNLKGKTVWYVPLGGSLPIFQGFGAGVKQAVEAAGMKFHSCDGKLVPTTEVSCLNQAASQGAAAVIASYIDYTDASSAYDNLIAHHIPVLISGEAPSGGKKTSAKLAFYASIKSFETAINTGLDSIIADSNGKAHILFMGITDTQSTKKEAKQTDQYIAKACPDCTFDRVMYNTADLTKVPSLVSSALISHPDTNYVVVQVDSGEPATIKGIQSAGFADKVKLVAISGTLKPIQAIKSGRKPTQLADVGLSPIYSGWQWTDGVIRMMHGNPPIPTKTTIRIFTKHNVSDLTLTPSAYKTNAWYGSNKFKDIYLRAWGVK
jgi:ribose transport system substrate-binding protein